MSEELIPEKKEEDTPAALPEERAEEKLPAAPTEERKWYILQTLTGSEELVKASIERSVKQFALENRVFNILVPEEDIVEIKDGKRVEKKKKMFPGFSRK